MLVTLCTVIRLLRTYHSVTGVAPIDVLWTERIRTLVTMFSVRLTMDFTTFGTGCGMC